MALGQYIFRRLILAIPTLLGVTIAVFLLIRLIPGDPARIIAGVTASDEEVRRIRVELGLTKPLHVQYLVFLNQLRRGDLGRSAVTRAPVTEEIALRLPQTVMLAVASSWQARCVGSPFRYFGWA